EALSSSIEHGFASYGSLRTDAAGLQRILHALSSAAEAMRFRRHGSQCADARNSRRQGLGLLTVGDLSLLGAALTRLDGADLREAQIGRGKRLHRAREHVDHALAPLEATPDARERSGP